MTAYQTNYSPCDAIGCKDPQGIIYSGRTYSLCGEHNYGEFYTSGEPFEQYQIIEKDFLEFMSYIPLTKKHLTVESPFLRDIIIRCCVQVEVFFLEWAKVEAADKTTTLYDEYIYGRGKPKKPNKKKLKNWDIRTYSYFAPKFENHDYIKVVPLNEEIRPFEGWTVTKPPFWWSAYNKLKHNGHKNKSLANYETAMFALAALFQLHCRNKWSKEYLEKVIPFTISTSSGVRVKKGSLATPLDTNKKLFKSSSSGGWDIELVTRKELPDLIKKMGKRI